MWGGNVVFQSKIQIVFLKKVYTFHTIQLRYTVIINMFEKLLYSVTSTPSDETHDVAYVALSNSLFVCERVSVTYSL